jgi:adenine-specific DNA-methyltransferase
MLKQTRIIEADSSVSRSGETLRQNNWIDELLKSGVRGKSGGQIHLQEWNL